MSLLIDIADALVAHLNVAGLGFTATRVCLPTFTREELQTLHVTVVPIAQAPERAARGTLALACTCHVGVQQQCDPSNPTEVDALLDIVESIIAHLHQQSRMTMLPDAVITGVENTVAYSVEHLEQQRVFSSLLVVSCRAWR